MTEILELPDRNFNAAIIKMLHKQLQKHLKQMKKKNLSKEIESLYKEIEHIKRNQIEIFNCVKIHITCYHLNFFFFWTTPLASGGSQAGGLIGAVAAGLCHSHSNTGSKLHL